MASTKSKTTAKQSYEERRQNVAKLLKSIQQQIEKKPAEEINWAHVGSMGYIETSLQEIADFLSGEE